MHNLYPLKFYPLLKDKVWGGHKIGELFGVKSAPLPNCGELWVLSGIEGNETIVSNGPFAENTLNDLIEVYLDNLLGEKVYRLFGTTFPLLFKFIDAKERLSLQVHPDDSLASQRGLGLGKTEMWYVVQADEGAQLISGFNKKISKTEYANRLRDKKLQEVLNVEEVEKGDVFFVPAGAIHALCEGVVVAEIQQSSDVTYRIDDWGRVGTDGNPRELHIADSVEAIDFALNEGGQKIHYPYALNESVPLVNCPQFTTQLLHLSEGLAKDYEELDSFVVYLCIEGICRVQTSDSYTLLCAGEALLIPACTQKVTIFPEKTVKILETFIS